MNCKNSLSIRNRDFIGCWIPDHVCYAVEENLSVFCSDPEALLKTEIKGSRLINLLEGISRQSNIKMMSWIPFGLLASSTLRIQEQAVQQNNLKKF